MDFVFNVNLTFFIMMKSTYRQKLKELKYIKRIQNVTELFDFLRRNQHLTVTIQVRFITKT
jgi:hypothetical protein